MSLVLFGLASMGIFVVSFVTRSFVEIPHLVEMAEWSVVWGGLSLAGVLVAGRLGFGRWLRAGPIAVLLTTSGIALSAIVHVVLQQWAIARYGGPPASSRS